MFCQWLKVFIFLAFVFRKLPTFILSFFFWIFCLRQSSFSLLLFMLEIHSTSFELNKMSPIPLPLHSLNRGLCEKPCQLWNGKGGNFFAYMEIILIQTDSHYERCKGHSIASWVQNTPKLTHLPLGLSLHSTKHIRALCLQRYNAVLSESW